MKLIVTRYRDRAELLACYQDAIEHGGLFVPTRRPREHGEHVILDIRAPKLSLSVMIRGQVVWTRSGRGPDGKRPGMGVQFLPGEHHKRDYLLAVIRGRPPVWKSERRHARLPLHMPGCWHLADDRAMYPCTISDISLGGAFLETSNVMPAGTSLVVQVSMPGSVAQHAIAGKVAWSSDNPGRSGMGVAFKSRDMAGKRRIRELVRRLRDDLLGSDTEPAQRRTFMA